MRELKLILLIVLATLVNYHHANADESPSISGDWQGELAISPQQTMQLIFHFVATEQGHKVTFDVPAQQQFSLEFNKVNIKSDKVALAFDAANIRYSAELVNNELVGLYQQGGFQAQLNLQPTEKKLARQKKQQEPSGPNSYIEKHVEFPALDNSHYLSGTLSYPEKDVHAVAILLSGSGPTTRDADVFGHKIFTVLADQLTKQGIAVLRYDDRGVGESTGDYAKATSADFADDANAAFEYLKSQQQFSNNKIGFVGHSEGGLIAAIAGSRNAQIDFIVSLAGLGTTGAQLLIDQSYYIQKRSGMEPIALKESDKAQRKIMAAVEAGATLNELVTLMKGFGMPEQSAQTQAKQLTSPWFKFFIETDPSIYLAKLTMPVLALNGELDSQVLPMQNIAGIKKSISSNSLTTKIYPNLNHLFQPAKTGLPNEYGQIDITFSEIVSDDIVQWLTALN